MLKLPQSDLSPLSYAIPDPFCTKPLVQWNGLTFFTEYHVCGHCPLLPEKLPLAFLLSPLKFYLLNYPEKLD